VKIEVISIPGCPNHQPTLDRVNAALRSGAVVADVREILVDNESEAQSLGFFGSPTVRVNGKDVEPPTGFRDGISCRIYADGTGIPPETALKLAIRSAQKEESVR
jgi:hypothetical protein